jgi:hypothetical protein
MIVKLPISEIVQQVCQEPDRDTKIQILRQWDSPALREYLRLAFSTAIKWRIPEGRPPFKPCREPDVEWAMYNELRRMYIFLPGQDNLSEARRQILFITLLESMPPSDAEFLCDVVKDHKIPEGLDLQTVKEAFRV